MKVSNKLTVAEHRVATSEFIGILPKLIFFSNIKMVNILLEVEGWKTKIVLKKACSSIFYSL